VGAPAGPLSNDVRPSIVNCFAVEDDEHFLALVVKMRANTALWLNDSAMKEKQIRVERFRI